jgi:hypothetical protein
MRGLLGFIIGIRIAFRLAVLHLISQILKIVLLTVGLLIKME